ncbi:site-2 protease family protein, partial [bacterium]|nr:site-2 protease family protein [bacterium]
MTILYFIVFLGILVFVHELGHFLVAKLVGVRVEAFSIGYPPRLFGFKKGDTDYCISAIPLGGYCKMAGQDDEDEGEKSNDPGMFYNKTVWQRMAIVFAGPIMNILLCILL